MGQRRNMPAAAICEGYRAGRLLFDFLSPAAYDICVNAHETHGARRGTSYLTRIYRALAHPVRFAILHYLTQREACVCHLMALLGRPQPYISQQLSVLRDAGLVADRRDGQMIYYRAADPAVGKLIEVAEDLLRRRGQAVELASDAGPLAGCSCPQCQTDSPHCQA